MSPSAGVALVVLLWTCPALAQLPAARLATVYPPGGAAGSQLDVALTGQNLDGATELRFTHPGIAAKRTGDATAGEAKFAVTIAADVPAGRFDCRAVGTYGITNPRAFVVGDQPEARNCVASPSPAKAGTIPLGSVVTGRTSVDAFDFWAFAATKGQRLMIDCTTREIDSRLDPSLAVLDGGGRELDRGRHGGFLDFTAPADGTYTLRVSDLLYRGGPPFAYRLSVSVGPHIDAIFPPVGKPGTTSAYTLLGRNLPGGTPANLKAVDGKALESLSVTIELPANVPAEQRLASAGLVGPSGVGLDGFAYRLKSDRGSSNPVAILFADADVTPEAESARASAARNDTPEDAQRLVLPAEVAGRFYPRGDRDWYAFEAAKGDAYVIEVVADRLNRPAAVSLLLQRVGPDGKATTILEGPEDEVNVGTPALRVATRDPVLRWEVKEDGRYRMCLRDKFGVVRDDPAAGYRLSIRKPKPDFRLLVSPLSAAPTDTAVWSPLLRRGGVAPLRVALLRLDGHAGDVTVDALGLPAGVTCPSLTLGGTDASGVLALRAAADAPAGSASLLVAACGKATAGRDLIRGAIGGTVTWGTAGDGKDDPAKSVDPVVSRLAGEAVVGVCAEDDPLVIAPAEERVYEVAPGAKLTVPLTVRAAGEVKQPLKLKPIGIDGLKGGKELTIDPKAKTATFELDLAQVKLAPGLYTTCLTGPAQMKYVATIPPPAGAADGKDKGAKKKDASREASLTVYSAPITFRVVPSVAVGAGR